MEYIYTGAQTADEALGPVNLAYAVKYCMYGFTRGSYSIYCKYCECLLRGSFTYYELPLVYEPFTSARLRSSVYVPYCTVVQLYGT